MKATFTDGYGRTTEYEAVETKEVNGVTYYRMQSEEDELVAVVHDDVFYCCADYSVEDIF